MMKCIGTLHRVHTSTDTTALPGAGAVIATTTATKKFNGSHCCFTNFHVPCRTAFKRSLNAIDMVQNAAYHILFKIKY